MKSSDKLESLLRKYTDAATGLAEAVKRNIKHDSKIDKVTVLALNEFIIAANEVSFFTDKLNNANIKLN